MNNNTNNIEIDEALDTVEGRLFIYKLIDFFVHRAREKVKNSIFKPMENESARRCYERYKFIYDKANIADLELCYLLTDTASRYIEFIEDDLNPDLQFPFDCDHLFDLHSWFKEIDIRHRSTYEILILLINKLYNSPYNKLF